MVRLFNDRGACLAGAVISPDVSRGTVQLATGAWYDPAEQGADGALDLHGNPNVLTIDRPTSKLAQAPIAHTALIEAERFADRPAETAAFKPPRILPGGPATA